MQLNPSVVIKEWDNDNGRGTIVKLFWDSQNAVKYGQMLVENYLEESNLTRESFIENQDELYEEKSENIYKFHSTYKDAVFHVDVYQDEFMDYPLNIFE